MSGYAEAWRHLAEATVALHHAHDALDETVDDDLRNKILRVLLGDLGVVVEQVVHRHEKEKDR